MFSMVAGNPPIETPRLRLRLATVEDVPAIVDYYVRNQEHLAPWEPLRPPGFYQERFWELQVQRNAEDFKHDVALRLFMFRRDDPTRVSASINFTQVVRGAAFHCVLGYSVDGHDQGHGLMTEGLRGAIDYVFREMRLHRIGANYMPRNERSGRLLRRLGFTAEGFARDYLLIAGRWEDHILTSLTNTDWNP